MIIEYMSTCKKHTVYGIKCNKCNKVLEEDTSIGVIPCITNTKIKIEQDACFYYDWEKIKKITIYVVNVSIKLIKMDKQKVINIIKELAKSANMTFEEYVTEFILKGEQSKKQNQINNEHPRKN